MAQIQLTHICCSLVTHYSLRRQLHICHVVPRASPPLPPSPSLLLLLLSDAVSVMRSFANSTKWTTSGGEKTKCWSISMLLLRHSRRPSRRRSSWYWRFLEALARSRAGLRAAATAKHSARPFSLCKTKTLVRNLV